MNTALFVAAIELLRTRGAPEWQSAALVPLFALFYVVLAPFVGALIVQLDCSGVAFEPSSPAGSRSSGGVAKEQIYDNIRSS